MAGYEGHTPTASDHVLTKLEEPENAAATGLVRAGDGGVAVENITTGRDEASEPPKHEDMGGPSTCGATLSAATDSTSASDSTDHRKSHAESYSDGMTGEETRRRSSSDLDVAKGDAVLRPIETLPGVVAHTVGNVVGAATLGAGFALGKADVALGRRGHSVPGLGGAEKISDSVHFKLGFRAWLYANGIMPTVLMEKGPYGNDIGPLPQDPDARRRLLRSTPIIVSNHVSYIDAVVLPLVLEAPKLMAMKEVATWPLFGQLCQEMEMIWVDRSDPTSRQAAKQAIGDHVEHWDDGERPLLIWPEGTCSNGRGLKDFKSGSFAPGVPVRPVVIKYTGDWDPANVNFRQVPSTPASGSCANADADAPYGDAEWAKQFFGHLFHSCTVLICRPYKPSEAEKKDPELYKTNVRKFMEQRLNELHEKEDRRRAEREMPGIANGLEKNARALIGNVAKGADKWFSDVSRGLTGAWAATRKASTERAGS